MPTLYGDAVITIIIAAKHQLFEANKVFINFKVISVSWVPLAMEWEGTTKNQLKLTILVVIPECYIYIFQNPFVNSEWISGKSSR